MVFWGYENTEIENLLNLGLHLVILVHQKSEQDGMFGAGPVSSSGYCVELITFTELTQQH